MEDATSIDDFTVINRELIGGLEVVEAAVADNLAMALATVLVRHKQHCVAMNALYASPDDKNLKYRSNDSRLRYSKARKRAYALLSKSTGRAVTGDTLASITFYASKDPLM